MLHFSYFCRSLGHYYMSIHRAQVCKPSLPWESIPGAGGLTSLCAYVQHWPAELPSTPCDTSWAKAVHQEPNLATQLSQFHVTPYTDLCFAAYLNLNQKKEYKGETATTTKPKERKIKQGVHRKIEDAHIPYRWNPRKCFFTPSFQL